MIGRLFLVVLNEIEAEHTRQELERAGWTVDVEAEDHGRAYEFIRRERPDVLVIFLNQHPAAARKVARSVQMEDGLKDLPIVFVGGDADEREFAQAEINGARYIESGDLVRDLARYSQ